MKFAKWPVLFLMLAGQGCGNLSTAQEKVTEFELGSDLKLSVSEVYFSEDQRQNCEQNIKPCLQNGSLHFGAEFSAPLSYVKKMTLQTQGRSYQLDTSYMYNALLGSPSLVKNVVQYLYASCHTPNSCLVRGLFSDAGSSYVAEWMVIDGKSIRTILTSSQDVVSKFRESIKPPLFE